MNAKQIFSGLGLYLLTAMLAAANTSGPPWFRAHASGAETLALRGAAEFGAVKGVDRTGPFVLTLGPESPTGAVVFTWPDSSRPKPGVYYVSNRFSRHSGFDRDRPDDPADRRVQESCRHPHSYPLDRRPHSGTLRARGRRIRGDGHKDEDRRLVVHGAFNARPSLR